MENFTDFHGIWSLNLGDTLQAKQTLVSADSETCFTENRVYKVLRTHPFADPPCVVVLDDSGDENKIQPDFLVNFRVAKRAHLLHF